MLLRGPWRKNDDSINCRRRRQFILPRRRFLRGSSSSQVANITAGSRGGEDALHDRRVVVIGCNHLLQITNDDNAIIPTTTIITDVSLLFKQDYEKYDILDLSGHEGERMIDDNYFNIDLDDIKSTDVDNIEEDVDEHYKEEENKDRITIIHDNYKPNKPYRPPKKEV
jgi:hypothetical protein